MKKKATQERAKKTVQIVLEAALQVLIEHGYEKAATNRIAERSGFGVGTLYQYFEDKEDIYHELVNRELDRIVSILEQPDLQPTLEASLRRFLQGAIQTIKVYPHTFRAIEPLLAGPFKANRAAARARAGAAMTRVLDHHREEIAVDDLEAAGHFLIVIAEGIATCADPDIFSSTELEEQALLMMLTALGKPSMGD